MNRREFLVRYRDVDAVVVVALYDAYLRSDWNGRGSILAALDKLQSAAVLALAQIGTRRPPTGGWAGDAPETSMTRGEGGIS